jgi:hypothetical protein
VAKPKQNSVVTDDWFCFSKPLIKKDSESHGPKSTSQLWLGRPNIKESYTWRILQTDWVLPIIKSDANGLGFRLV